MADSESKTEARFPEGAESHGATFEALSEEERHSHLLLQLVTSMHMGAMYQLGKVASPMTGKVERDLKQAQYTIDLIAMLAARTKGNLTSDEETFITRTLSELRMNFLDEASKPEPVDSEEESAGDASAPDADSANVSGNGSEESSGKSAE